MAFKISAVVESIKQPITKDYLLNYVANYGFRDDHAMMPPPQAPQVHIVLMRIHTDRNMQQLNCLFLCKSFAAILQLVCILKIDCRYKVQPINIK